ncbi:hypothetical protein IW146_009275, partial [Coemansia sp. RSA 922]
MISFARAVPSAAFATIAVGLLRQASVHVSFYSGDKQPREVLCGKESHWDWSLDSDCFRVGFLWPILLLLVAGLSFAALAVYCLLPNSLESAGFCGVGNRENPVRRPLGPAIMRDNRTNAGRVVVALSVAWAALLLYAWNHKAEAAIFTHTFMLLAALFAVLIAISNTAFLAIYIYSDRLLYAGLFPWPLPTLVLLHLLIGSCETYYSFFTPATRNVPIIGSSASLYSNALAVSTLMSAILSLSYLFAQLRPVFVRPLVPGAIVDSEQPDYTWASNFEANGDNDDEATPLSSHTDQKSRLLVESSEFNVSWYSTLSYSWLNDILRKGSARRLEASDLYRLDKSDMPIPNWRRYLRHRKPGRSLLVTLLLVFAPEMILQTALSLAATVLQFSGPFFLQRILRSIDVLGGNNGNDNKLLAEKSIRSAYLDAFGLLFFTLAAATLSNQNPWIGRHTGLRIKGILVAELSSKTLRRRGKGSCKGKSLVDGVDAAPTAEAAADGKIMNLVSADFLRVVEAFAYPDKALSLPLMLLIGIWYMYMLLGVSALVGLTMTVLYMPLSKALLTYVAGVEEKLSSLSDKRVTVITELLQGIKAVKLFGWESRFLEMVDERRERQLKYVWKSMVGWVSVSAGSSFAPMLVLVAIFGVYVIGFGNKLTAEVAFTSISVFQFVREAFVHLPQFSSWIIGGYVALGRIDSYLSKPQVQDLEARVAHGCSDGDKLGFEGADLEWESSNSNKRPDSKGIVAGNDLTGVETFNITENTPLLTGSTAATATPLIQVALSPANKSYASLNYRSGDVLAKFALRDIDVQFPHGVLSIVAGPTGSGKSSLLSALIGEMTLTRGRILLPTVDSWLDANGDYRYRDIIEFSDEGLAIRDIAYVTQEAWLRNATIRENILFGEQYDAYRYEEVLRVCALKPDFRILSAGDQTEIGERGVTLSGGQKQRVALARAVYSSRRILLIDDCLSAVDAHTAKHILMECLLSKTPLMLGRTRVLVTHHVSMCLPFAQYIVMLREGQVSLKGNPAELQDQGVFTKALAELESNKDKEYDVDAKGKSKDAEQAKLTADVLDEEDPSKSVNDKTPEDEYNLRRLKKIAEQRGLDSNGDPSALQGTLVKDERRESGYVKSEVWLTYLNACGNKWFWIGASILLITCELIVVLHTYWIRIWVASTSSERQNHSAAYWIGIYVAIGVVGVIWRVLQMSFVYSGAVRAARSLHSQLLRRVVHATPRFFDSTPLSRIINLFSRDMYTIDESTMDPIVWWSRDLLSVICVFTIITAVTPAFVLVAISVSVLYVGIAYYYVSVSRELKRLESTSMSPLLSLFGELILGVSTIRAFGAKHFYIKEALNRINAHNRALYMTWATR